MPKNSNFFLIYKKLVYLYTVFTLMLKVLKINTAVIICLAFILRLYLINAGPISSLNSPEKNDKLISKAGVLSIQKNTSFNGTDESKSFPAIEICEENSDSEEDDSSKTSAFIILQVLYSSFINDIYLRSNTLFDHINHKVASKKYLAISVLRI